MYGSLTAALNGYFGKRPGDSLLDFKKELEKLTPQDRKELEDEFVRQGLLTKEEQKQ